MSVAAKSSQAELFDEPTLSLGARKPRSVGADVIALELQQIDRQRRELELRFMDLIVEAECQGAHEEYGHEDVSQFVSQVLGHGYQVTLTRCMVAQVLSQLPKTREAFRQGKISYDHLRAICQVIDAETEDAILEEVAQRPARDAFKLLELIKKVDDDDEVEARRGISFKKDAFRRTMTIEGVLPIEEGQAIKECLDELANEMPREEGSSHLAYRRADALFELTQGGAPKPATIFAHADLDKLFAEGRLKVNLPQLDVQANKTPRISIAPPPEKDGDDFSLVDKGTLEVGLGAQLEGGFSLSESTLDRLCCDSLVKLVGYVDGKPIDLGRAYRTVNQRLRRLLMLGYGRCAYPECKRKSALEAHHLTEYQRGGRTDLDNLAMVCHIHHKLLHHRKWRLKRVRGRFVVERPQGAPISSIPTINSLKRAIRQRSCRSDRDPPT